MPDHVEAAARSTVPTFEIADGRAIVQLNRPRHHNRHPTARVAAALFCASRRRWAPIRSNPYATPASTNTTVSRHSTSCAYPDIRQDGGYSHRCGRRINTTTPTRPARAIVRRRLTGPDTRGAHPRRSRRVRAAVARGHGTSNRDPRPHRSVRDTAVLAPSSPPDRRSQRRPTSRDVPASSHRPDRKAHTG